jgi:hypothetical protein
VSVAVSAFAVVVSGRGGGQLFRREFETLRPVQPAAASAVDERDARDDGEADRERPARPPAHVKRARREDERQRDLVSQQASSAPQAVTIKPLTSP